MSVHYEEVVAAPPLERRRTPRFRFGILMPAVLGRGDALILDVSTEGARVMQFVGHALDSDARLVFFYAGRRFSVTARVLASRVIGLGNGPGGSTSYESRLHFADCPTEAAETLHFIIEKIASERRVPKGNAGYFMRCRPRGERWTKSWTYDATQPADGFTVPATLSEGEVEILCEAYAKMDDEGRDLIRATATMSAGNDQSALPSRP